LTQIIPAKSVHFFEIIFPHPFQIGYSEFVVGLKSLNELKEFPLADTQIEEIFQLIDKDNNKEIDYKEFMDAFEIVDTQK
jgi:Ca2+-binding EF-hand superfamily protein